MVSSTNTVGGIPQTVAIFPAKPFGLAGDFVVSPYSHRIQPVLLAGPGTHSGSQFGDPFFKFADGLFKRFRHGDSIAIYLLDTSGTVWNSVALPRSPYPSFSAFDNRDITTFADNRLGQMAETFQVTLTDMQQVPEPGTACLMTLGILGLVVACRGGLCRRNCRIEA